MLKRRKYWGDFLKEHRKEIKEVLGRIEAEGPMSSGDFGDDRRVMGYWIGSESLVKRILDVLWEIGEVMIDRRKARQRYLDISDRILPLEDTSKTFDDFLRRVVMDRFHAMRLVRNKSVQGVAWNEKRYSKNEYFDELESDGVIVPVSIEGVKSKFHILKEDTKFLKGKKEIEPTTRLIAPLDMMVWDRNLVREIFDFHPTFEVYKPAAKREYGYYCLFILHGTELVGRCDLAKDKKSNALNVLSVHWEPGVEASDGLLRGFTLALDDHARFLSLDLVALPLRWKGSNL